VETADLSADEVVSAEARWVSSHCVDRPMTSLRVYDADQVQTLVFGPIHSGHFTKVLEYVEVLRGVVGGSAEAVTTQLRNQSTPLPSRQDVEATIWPEVIHETDVCRMFGSHITITPLRKADMASFRKLEDKVDVFIDRVKQDFQGIMEGFRSTRSGWRRKWAILSHLERQIIIRRLQNLSFGEALALLLYRAKT
jgi:hypothetical protein